MIDTASVLNFTNIPSSQEVNALNKTSDHYIYQLAVKNTLSHVVWLMQINQITEDIGKNLINMIDSKDRDNFYIAILAIEQITEA